jgi:hypothetical protein
MSEFEASGQALPAKAQRVGSKSESSTLRRSYEKEAIAAKNRAIHGQGCWREPQSSRRKPTECDDATLCKPHSVEAHIG